MSYKGPFGLAEKQLTDGNLILPEVLEEKTVTAVDVFVYDTSRDSDGGAWRNRCQHTSWYNETLNTATRGSRREFPAVAVIVAESAKVTIYDGDDPSLPMWMVFTRAGDSYFLSTSQIVTSITMLNGVLCFGTSTTGTREINFLTDSALMRRTTFNAISNNIAGRNSGNTIQIIAGGVIVNDNINDVAMTVLPGAPIDPVTGVQIPTIAVATDGGVSVIKDDGSVVDITSTSTAVGVVFDEDGLIYITLSSGSGRIIYGHTIPDSDKVVNVDFTFRYNNSSISAAYQGIWTGIVSPVTDRDYLILGTEQGARKTVNTANAVVPSTNVQAIITSNYNSGWMHGDIKGAWLADTTAGSITGTELVTNGTFDTDINDWSGYFDGRATISWESGKLRITNDVGGYGLAEQVITTIPGRRYKFTATASQASGDYNSRIVISTFSGGSDIAVTTANKVSDKSIDFTAPSTSVYILLHLFSSEIGPNVSIEWDNVSVRLAEPDRSVNSNGLAVHGTLTKSPVAPGSELVAYSGFDGSNYLQGTVDTGGDAYGWELKSGVWTFCRTLADFTGISESGGTLTINAGDALVLIRYTLTTPSTEQLDKIEQDEKVLFQENTACTLYGSSDAVTALAHDPVTDLLHVGTSAGRSVFQGLRRVDNTTDAVGSAISAVNNLVVED